MIAPLSAPIEVPMTQSGSMPASCIAWNTPTWYAPSAPPPCSTSTTCPGSSSPSPAIFTMAAPRLFRRCRSCSFALSVRGPAPVDRQHRARDRSRCIGAQKCRELGDLLDGDELTRRLRREQDVAHDLLLGDSSRFRRVRDLLLDERRPDVARAYGVYGDSVLGDFERGRLSESCDSVLGCDVRRLERARNERVRRSDVDDSPPPLLLHGRQRDASRVKRSRQVDREDRIPFVDRKLLDRRDMLDAGVVDEQVDRAEA